MSEAQLQMALGILGAAVAAASLAANLYQYWRGRARRSAVERQAAVRTRLVSVLTTLELVVGDPHGADWAIVFEEVERAHKALVELDAWLVTETVPLAAVAAVTRLILSCRAVLQWRGGFMAPPGGGPGGVIVDPWPGAEADYARLRRDASLCQPCLRAVMARLNG